MIAARPLTLGEIFDRGITLFVRNAPLVLVLAALYYVPHAIFDGYDSSAKDALASLVTLAANPQAAIAAQNAAPKPVFDVAAGIRLADTLLVWPLINAVIVAALGSAYGGASPTFVGALRTGFSRWGASVVAWLAFFASLAVAVIPLAVVVALPGGLAAAAAVGSGLSGSGLVALIAVVIAPFALLALAVVLFLVTVSSVAASAVVVERVGGLTGFAAAWRRTLRMPRRAVLVGGAQIGISCVAGIVANTIGDAILLLTHLVPIAIAVNAASEIAVLGLLWGITIVYYEDQRVRSDGRDLLAAVMPLGASSGSLIA